MTVAFTEKTGATLIRDLQLRPVFSKGEFVIEAATGRVRRAQLGVTIGSVTLELTTTYAPEERLGLWVPVLFRERYEEGVALSVGARTLREAGQARLDSASSYEEIVCEAKYTNYRRFEATARIKR